MPLTNVETLADLVRYSSWASRKLLTFALTAPQEVITRNIPNSHGGLLKTFQHIYYADRIWLARLEQSSTEFSDPGDGPSLTDLDQLWWPLLERLSDHAASSDPAGTVTFKRVTGDIHTLERGPIIRHVVNHATYHRGQIAAMFRQNGFVPPSTDLLYYHLNM